ncbi:hypothetical protein ACW0JT_12615 [Arthrobacter sp. SA17]
MTGTGISASLRLTSVLLVAAAAMAACSNDGKGTPAWTAGASPSDSASQATTANPTETPVSATAEATPSGAETPVVGATASAWKVFNDPGKTVSFELPQEWITQSLPPVDGSLPGALKIEVKDSKGAYLATLQTGLPAAAPVDCAAAAAKPYVVVSSVPVELPHADGEGTIPPRVVFRVIQGYKFFGSFGITNMVGGTDGKACTLQNVVRGPAGKGNYSFGDLTALKAFATDEKVAPAKSFDTLDQAAKYVNEGSEFANVQRMLMSLKINN